ncbi:MAG TPA: hypothetical protein VI451_14290 [Anaerolineales bacterium]|nr:hypothetical protein [Anaerolineales bacterium]
MRLLIQSGCLQIEVRFPLKKSSETWSGLSNYPKWIMTWDETREQDLTIPAAQRMKAVCGVCG